MSKEDSDNLEDVEGVDTSVETSSSVNDTEIDETEIDPKNMMSHENTVLRNLMDSNFIEYASYVIKERAIPNVDDGLKPVQRRILWSLLKMHDGKFHKVANIIGHTMQFHPHGDASIGDALVVLANKEFFIEKQGNFGNILTGDCASAPRYIECRLKPFATDVLPNNDLTEFVDSYDGRNKEPVCFPCKVPALLMQGADGIAVGMSTTIMPHNFIELLEAQISVLRGEDFQLYPDFLQGGLMDVSDYSDGNGKIQLRAKMDIVGRKVVIHEVPATSNTEKLIASIERAAAKGKIKIASVSDFTTDEVEIEVTPVRGYDPKKLITALYAYTDCSVSVSPNLIVIMNNRPVQMTVTQVITRNTARLQEYLRRELELELAKLQDRFHDKTLAQIFIENRIYKRIESCDTFDLVISEVRKGVEEYRHMLHRDVTDEDIEKLLTIPIRRISLFDINKNKRDLEEILADIDQIKKKLKRIKAYTIKYIEAMIDKYKDDYPRRTVIEEFEKIDLKAAALSNIKVGWDKKNGYVGTKVKSDEVITLSEYDNLLCMSRDGSYKVINIPDKVFVGRLYYFMKYDKNLEYGIIYREKKSKKCYAKRVKINKFITDKDYMICPEGCKIEVITSRPNSVYRCTVDGKKKGSSEPVIVDLLKFPMRSTKARGQLVASKPVSSFKYVGASDNTSPNSENATAEQEQDIASEAVSDGVTENDNKKFIRLREIKRQFNADALDARNQLNPEMCVDVDATEIDSSDVVGVVKKTTPELCVSQGDNNVKQDESIACEASLNEMKQDHKESSADYDNELGSVVTYVKNKEHVVEKNSEAEAKLISKRIEADKRKLEAGAVVDKDLDVNIESSSDDLKEKLTLLDEPSLGLDIEPEENNVKKSSKRAYSKKTNRGGDDDDLGISQPEFGF